MAKSKLKMEQHWVLPGHEVVEVWYEDQMIATVTGADGPGVRVITKHPLDIVRGGLGEIVRVIEIQIDPKNIEGG